MTRHFKYEPGPIPTFWKHEMTLGKITELEYYKHVFPRTIIKAFIKKMEFIELESENPKKMAREYKIEYKERIK